MKHGLWRTELVNLPPHMSFSWIVDVLTGEKSPPGRLTATYRSPEEFKVMLLKAMVEIDKDAMTRFGRHAGFRLQGDGLTVELIGEKTNP